MSKRNIPSKTCGRLLKLTLSAALLTQTSFGHLPEHKHQQKLISPLSHLASVQSLPVDLTRAMRIQSASLKQGQPVIYLFQDVHLNEEAQRCIAQGLRSLIQSEKKLTRVGIEGTVGAFDIVPFQRMASPIVVRKVAEEFIHEGRMGAVPYVGLTAEPVVQREIKIIGLETPDLYLENIRAYRDAVAIKPVLEREVASNKSRQKREWLALRPEIRLLLEKKDAYESGGISLGEYGLELSRKIGNEQMPFNLEAFLTAYEIERSLNFKEAEREKNRCLSFLANKMSPADIVQWHQKTVDMKGGLLGLGEYFHFVHGEMVKHRVNLSAFPAFKEYLQYLFLSESLDAERLFSDLRSYEHKVFEAFHTSRRENGVIAEARSLNLTAKLLQFALTPEEWKELRLISRVPQFKKFSPFLRFYEIAENRNEVMINNLSPTGSAAIIAGGFHTPGLKEHLQDKGFGIVVLSPRITRVDCADGSDYLGFFMEEKAPLQKLFSGRTLFLNLPEGIGFPPQPYIPPLRDPRHFAERCSKYSSSQNPQGPSGPLPSFAAVHEMDAQWLWNRVYERIEQGQGVQEEELKGKHQTFASDGSMLAYRDVSMVIQVPPTTPIGQKVVKTMEELKKAFNSAGLGEKVFMYPSQGRHITIAAIDLNATPAIKDGGYPLPIRRALVDLARKVLPLGRRSQLLVKGVNLSPAWTISIKVAPAQGMADDFKSMRLAVQEASASPLILEDGESTFQLSPFIPDYYYLNIGVLREPLNNDELVRLAGVIEKYRYEVFGTLDVNVISVGETPHRTGVPFDEFFSYSFDNETIRSDPASAQWVTSNVYRSWAHWETPLSVFVAGSLAVALQNTWLWLLAPAIFWSGHLPRLVVWLWEKLHASSLPKHRNPLTLGVWGLTGDKILLAGVAMILHHQLISNSLPMMFISAILLIFVFPYVLDMTRRHKFHNNEDLKSALMRRTDPILQYFADRSITMVDSRLDDFRAGRTADLPPGVRVPIVEGLPADTSVDVLILFGSHFLDVPKKAAPIFARLYQRNQNMKVITTGFRGWQPEQAVPEAIVFKYELIEAYRKLGPNVPIIKDEQWDDIIITDPKAANTGENVYNTVKLIDQQIGPVKSVMLLTAPPFQTRARDTFLKHCPWRRYKLISYTPYAMDLNSLSPDEVVIEASFTLRLVRLLQSLSRGHGNPMLATVPIQLPPEIIECANQLESMLQIDARPDIPQFAAEHEADVKFLWSRIHGKIVAGEGVLENELSGAMQSYDANGDMIPSPAITTTIFIPKTEPVGKAIIGAMDELEADLQWAGLDKKVTVFSREHRHFTVAILDDDHNPKDFSPAEQKALLEVAKKVLPIGRPTSFLVKGMNISPAWTISVKVAPRLGVEDGIQPVREGFKSELSRALTLEDGGTFQAQPLISPYYFVNVAVVRKPLTPAELRLLAQVVEKYRQRVFGEVKVNEITVIKNTYRPMPSCEELFIYSLDTGSIRFGEELRSGGGGFWSTAEWYRSRAHWETPLSIVMAGAWALGLNTPWMWLLAPGIFWGGHLPRLMIWLWEKMRGSPIEKYPNPFNSTVWGLTGNKFILSIAAVFFQKILFSYQFSILQMAVIFTALLIPYVDDMMSHHRERNLDDFKKRLAQHTLAIVNHMADRSITKVDSRLDDYRANRVPDLPAGMRVPIMGALPPETRVDVLVLFGSHYLDVPRNAAALFAKLHRYNPDLKVVTAGCRGWRRAQPVPEAIVFKYEFIEAYRKLPGVPEISDEKWENIIFTEPMSTNTGENVINTSKLIDEKIGRVDSVLLMTAPSFQLRARDSFLKNCPWNDFTLISHSAYVADLSNLSFEETVEEAKFMVKMLKDLKDYSRQKGNRPPYSVPIEFPENVLAHGREIERILNMGVSLPSQSRAKMTFRKYLKAILIPLSKFPALIQGAADWGQEVRKRSSVYPAGPLPFSVGETNPHGYLRTRAGAVSLGISMLHFHLFTGKDEFPRIILAPQGKWVGPSGENLMEVFFAAFVNFKFFDRKTILVCTQEQRDRLRKILSLSNPSHLPNVAGYPQELIDRIKYEAVYFADRSNKYIDANGQVFYGPTRVVSPASGEEMIEYRIVEDARPVAVEGVQFRPRKDGSYEIFDQDRVAVLRGHRLRGLKVEFPSVQKLTKRPLIGVTFLGQSGGFDPDGMSSSLIYWMGKQGVLVDAGPATVSLMKSLGVTPINISHLVLTHMHPDHVAGALEYLHWAKSLHHPVKIIMEPGLFQHFSDQASLILGKKLTGEYPLDLIPLKFYEKQVVGQGDEAVLIETIPSFHGTPGMSLRFTYRGRTLAHSSDTAYDPRRIEDIANMSIPQVDINRDLKMSGLPEGHSIFGSSSESIESRKSELSQWLFRENSLGHSPSLIVFESGAAQAPLESNDSNHTSPFALARLPGFLQEVMFVNHTPLLPDGEFKFRLARPFQTVNVTDMEVPVQAGAVGTGLQILNQPWKWFQSLIRTVGTRRDGGVQKQAVMNMTPGVQSLRLDQVGESFILAKGKNPQRLGLSIFKIKTEEEAWKLDAYIRRLGDSPEARHFEAVVVVAKSRAVINALKMTAQNSSLAMAVLAEDNSPDQKTDLARAIEIALTQNAVLTKHSAALLVGELDIRLYVSSPDWYASPIIQINGREISTVDLTIHVFWAHFISDLVREVGVVKNINQFFEHFNQAFKAVASSA